MKKSITSNYIYNLIYQLVITIVPLITTPYLTRTLGPTNLGIYSYTLSIITAFYLLSSLGINTYGQREIAYNQDNIEETSKTFIELIILRFISTIISILLLIPIIIFETKYNLYYQIFLIYVIANFFDITWLYQGIENFKTITLRNTFVRILYLISIFVFIKKESDLSIYILLFSTMTLLTNLTLWINLKKIIIKPKKIELKKHLKPVIYFFIPQIATIIYTILDKTMLGILGNDIKQVSFYEQASYILKTILIILTLTNTIMISKISYAFKNNNKKQITTYLTKIINFIWILGIPLTFGVCAVIKNFVPWFYGTEYQSVTNLVYAMSPIIIIISLNNLLGIQFLVSTQNQSKYILSIIIGAISNFILNLVLIPHFGPIGATISTVFAELLILLIELYFTKKIISNINILKNSIKYTIFGIILFITSYLSGYILGPTIQGTILQTIIGLSIYSSLLILSKDPFLYETINKFKKIIHIKK